MRMFITYGCSRDHTPAGKTDQILVALNRSRPLCYTPLREDVLFTQLGRGNVASCKKKTWVVSFCSSCCVLNGLDVYVMDFDDAWAGPAEKLENSGASSSDPDEALLTNMPNLNQTGGQNQDMLISEEKSTATIPPE